MAPSCYWHLINNFYVLLFPAPHDGTPCPWRPLLQFISVAGWFSLRRGPERQMLSLLCVFLALLIPSSPETSISFLQLSSFQPQLLRRTGPVWFDGNAINPWGRCHCFSPAETRVFSNVMKLFMPDATSYVGGGLGI